MFPLNVFHRDDPWNGLERARNLRRGGKFAGQLRLNLAACGR